MTRHMHPPLVLASSSPFRAQLLEKLGLPFQATSPDIDEWPQADESPEQLVLRLSEEKARKGAQTFPDSLIIGSDQIALCQNQILGKPGSHSKAVQQLQAASGQTVRFLTGLALFNAQTGRMQSVVEPFDVQFRTLTLAQIEGYLHKEQPYQCAGSFKSEGLGISLFSRLRGDDPNSLIGLPLIRLVQFLELEGIDVLQINP